MSHKVSVPLAVLAAVGALFVVSGPASAEGRGGEVTADFSTPLFVAKGHLIQRSADPTDASGYIDAHPAPPVVDRLRGPGRVVCVDIRGNTVGLVYVLDDETEPGVAEGAPLYATAVDNGPGHKDLSGFVPAVTTTSCAPGLAPLQPVTSGDIKIRDR